MRRLALRIIVMVLLASEAAAEQGFVLRAGRGEALLNGLVVKASPRTGTSGPILVEQTFARGGGTPVHVHDQGDELFYVLSGTGTARLGSDVEEIGPGDVIFVAQGGVHRLRNPDRDEPLRVVFFMASPELVEVFRALHERVTSDPDQPITSEERAEIERRIGGSRTVSD